MYAIELDRFFIHHFEFSELFDFHFCRLIRIEALEAALPIREKKTVAANQGVFFAATYAAAITLLSM